MKTFVLCPQEEVDRKERAIEHFTQRGLDVVFFNPLHAATAGFRTTQTYDQGNGQMGPKQVGIWLAHWSLWNALQFLPDSHFFILELDAQFAEDWEPRLANALRAVPDDYDFLYVGSCCTADKPKRAMGAGVYEVRWPQCLHAYVVSKKVLPLLLSTLRRCWAPIDIQLTLEVFPKPEVKCYCVLPRIVSQFNTVIPP